MDHWVFIEYTLGWIHSSWKTGAGEHPILNLVLRPNEDNWPATVDQIFQSNTEDTSMLPWVMNSLKSYASFPLARGTGEHISAAPALAYNPIIWLGRWMHQIDFSKTWPNHQSLLFLTHVSYWRLMKVLSLIYYGWKWKCHQATCLMESNSIVSVISQ